ncbi:MAG: hypothetical protein JO296_07665 [Pseudonocardiales bacterium]|nr:hypothetical protein [Pseudonocardiales bacterium]MBV9649998.1 hypothetical protein [Pseudonocardiales bacterium]
MRPIVAFIVAAVLWPITITGYGWAAAAAQNTLGELWINPNLGGNK